MNAVEFLMKGGHTITFRDDEAECGLSVTRDTSTGWFEVHYEKDDSTMHVGEVNISECLAYRWVE